MELSGILGLLEGIYEGVVSVFQANVWLGVGILAAVVILLFIIMFMVSNWMGTVIMIVAIVVFIVFILVLIAVMYKEIGIGMDVSDVLINATNITGYGNETLFT